MNIDMESVHDAESVQGRDRDGAQPGGGPTTNLCLGQNLFLNDEDDHQNARFIKRSLAENEYRY